MAFAAPSAPDAERLSQGVRLFSDCWRWSGAHSPKGYGLIRKDGRLVGVHRLAYQTWCGEIPEGMEINHLCYIRDCVNPDHLEVVTHAENIKKRSGKPYTHSRLEKFVPNECHHGHAYTPENTILYRGKYRACRACHNQDIARRKHLRKVG